MSCKSVGFSQLHVRVERMAEVSQRAPRRFGSADSGSQRLDEDGALMVSGGADLWL
jgi:hypothetical protein